MKKTIQGLPAYSKMLIEPAPERTKTYTPIAHSNVISQIRKDLFRSGFKIIDEDYRCTSNASVALGMYKVEYSSDPDIDLMITFLNSYDTTYAFRYSLGASVKVNKNLMFNNTGTYGFYKKFHKGDADILSSENMAAMIKSIHEYWDQLVLLKDRMKATHVEDCTSMYKICNKLFFEMDILNAYQLNIIKDQMRKPKFNYGIFDNSAWAYFNHIAYALQQSHPSDIIPHHQLVLDLFAKEFDLLPSVDTEDKPTTEVIDEEVNFAEKEPLLL